MSITVAQIEAAVAAIEGIHTGSLKAAIASNFSDMADDAIVLEDALAVLAVFFPEAGALASVIALLVAIAPLVSIHPDPDPEVDANEYQGRGGRGN